MTTYKLLFAALGAGQAGTVCGLLDELPVPAADAVSMFECASGNWTVEAYYQGEPDLKAIIEALGPIAGEVVQAPRVEPLPDENWVALSQSALPPVTAGRFLVFGAHDRHRTHGHMGAIEIDAGEAFGTAHHATTLGCLLAIDHLTRSRVRVRALAPAPRRALNTVLDLGCGSGVLAIAAAKALPGAAIIASDIDPDATAVAARNVRLNGKAGRIRVITAAGMAHRLMRGPARFDLVVANILAAPLVVLAPDIARAIGTGGVCVLSGLLTEQAPQVSAAYVTAGFSALRHRRLGEWSTLTLERR